jgi:hypothetical protein
VHRYRLEEIDMIIGPILNRSGGYCFDIWTAAKGVNLGYTYRRIEDAYYDRKLTLEASRRAPTLTTIACETADAFQNEVQRTGCLVEVGNFAITDQTRDTHSRGGVPLRC